MLFLYQNLGKKRTLINIYRRSNKELRGGKVGEDQEEEVKATKYGKKRGTMEEILTNEHNLIHDVRSREEEKWSFLKNKKIKKFQKNPKENEKDFALSLQWVYNNDTSYNELWSFD